MESFETQATVQPQGDVRVPGVPFAPGTEVEVSISPKRKSASEFAAAWERVCRELRNASQGRTITDADIQHEVDEFRSGR